MGETKPDASETGIVKTEIDMALKHLGSQAFVNERVTHALTESKRIIEKQARENDVLKEYLKTFLDAQKQGAALIPNETFDQIAILLR